MSITKGTDYHLILRQSWDKCRVHDNLITTVSSHGTFMILSR